MASETLQDLLSKRYSDRLVPNTVIHLTEGAVGVFGNILVLIMYSRFIVDKSGTRYFIPILALVDLIGCLSNVVQFQLDNTMQYVYPDVHLCKILFFLMIMSGGFSAHLIFAIALQRYLMICRPFGQQMTQKYCRIAIGTIFIFCSGYAAPVLTFSGIHEKSGFIKIRNGNLTRNISYTARICHFDDSSYGPLVMVPYFGTLLVLSFMNIIATSCLYIPVAKTIYKSFSLKNNLGNKASRLLEVNACVSPKEAQSPSEKNALKTDREQKARKRISVMFLIIILVYTVSYLTSLATQVYEFLTTELMSRYRLNIHMFCLRLNLLNHIANPYIYWFYDVKFRRQLQKVCCKRHQGKHF